MFSYAHEDHSFRDELEKHLSMLKREGLIEAWHDRRIGAGLALDKEIQEHFETADIVLLLVSSDFLASDYCYHREMKRSLERHGSGDAIVIPVILRPCDWKHSPFGHLRATPPDGKPISSFSNLDEAYLAVVRDIRDALERIGAPRATLQAPDPAPSEAPVASRPRSSNLRVKKTFTEREKDDFLESTFEYIANYFQGSLEELCSRNSDLESKFKRVGAEDFEAAVYRLGSKITSCRIRLTSLGSGSKGITFLASDTEREGSFNDMLHVHDDGYSMLLDGIMPAFSGEKADHLTQEGASEYFWSLFIERLQ